MVGFMIGTVPSLLSAGAALAFVLLLVLGAGRIARLGGFAPHATARATARATGRKELMVQEVLALDSRRRLSLVRCGGRRVLLLTGGTQDVVVGWMPDGNAP